MSMTQPSPNPISFFTQASGGHPEPLTPEQLSQITHARARYKKVQRATSVAAIDAWSTAIFAGLSLLISAISFSFPGILVGMGMAVVSYNSFRGLKMMRKLDPAAARVLGQNQLFLGSVLFLYAAWNLFLLLIHKADLGISTEMRSQLNDVGGDWVIGLYRYIYYAVYGGLVAFAIIVQGLTALYYFSRKKCIDEYLERTAEWVLQMQKMGFKL